jgi:tetratricopeptide (TPR) repeat protein
MDDGTTALDALLKAMLGGMRDARVARALGARWPEGAVEHEPDHVWLERGGLADGLLAALDAQLLPRIRERLGDEAEEFGEVPAEAAGSADAVFGWVVDERPQFRDLAVAVVAGVLAGFVGDHRDEIVASMRAAGEAPGADREARMAEAEALLADAATMVSALEGLPTRSESDPVDAILEPAIAPMERAREILEEVALDDGILGVPAGSVAALDRLRDAWMAEVDAYVAAAGKIGPPLEQAAVGTFEQQIYLLDAIVALQEALTLRVDLQDLLRLAHLRLAKGDIGEARAIAERILAGNPDDELRAKAEALRDSVSASSPLGRDKRCFIATAALGADAAEVECLRAWRDDVLYPTRSGRAAISAYYRVSPPIARVIAAYPTVRRFVRSVVVLPAAHLAEAWMRRRPS